MKDSQAEWWCKFSAALFTSVLTSWFSLTQALEYLRAYILHGGKMYGDKVGECLAHLLGASCNKEGFSFAFPVHAGCFRLFQPTSFVPVQGNTFIPQP